MNERAYIRLDAARRSPYISTNGGGPQDPNLEARLTKLEDDMQSMRLDMTATRSDTAYIRGRLESLPNTWQMIGTVLAGNIGLAGVLLAAIKLMAAHS
jgi:hypothetical protein